MARGEMASLTYSAESATHYAVRRDGSHRIGTVHKFGFRWLAISPAHRSLGSFASMSEAGKRLIREDEKNEPGISA